MPTLERPDYEVFAKERANGASVAVAGERAGFSKKSGHAWDLEKNEEIKARVRELQEEAATLQLVQRPVLIARLLAIADKAEKMDSAAGMAAARAALMDAARLHGVAEPTAQPTGPAGPSRPIVFSDHPLSEDEWTRVFASGA